LARTFTFIFAKTAKRRRSEKGKEKVDIEGEEEDISLGGILNWIDPEVTNRRATVRRKRALAQKGRKKRKKRPLSIRQKLVAKLKASRKRAITALRNAERDLIALKAQRTRTILTRAPLIKEESLDI